MKYNWCFFNFYKKCKKRMLYKIGSVTDDFMQRLEKRIMKNLDIKIPKEEKKRKKSKIAKN